MAVPNTFSAGTLAKSSEINENFAWTGLVPIGTVLPWLKSLTNCPALDDRFVECNGQTLSDAESVFDGVTLPDLNGDAQFLYGAATSGGTKTEDFLPSHKHNTNNTYNASNQSLECNGSGGSWNGNVMQNTTSGTAWEGYAVVYIIRVK